MKAFLIFSILLAQSISFAAAKKNVCSITINSSDEINVFKSKLSPDEFNFIELTENQKGSTDWFKNSCASKVECDILLISGHFGGTFFGQSGLTLSINELEKASCSSECDGIIKKPKEVFLFGCNTLAGKNADPRTPEEYIQALVNDSFTLSEAQQVAAFLHSPVGSRISYRMSQTFNKTPRIYGFNGRSPLGKYTGPLVKNYFQAQAKTQISYSNYLDTLNTDINGPLSRIFAGSAMVQEKGGSLNKTELSPVCYLSPSNTSTPRTVKLQWIADKLEQSESLELMTYFTDFFKEQKFQKNWTEEEQAIIAKIRDNQTLITKLGEILAVEKDWLKRSQAEVLEFMKVTGLMDAKKYNASIMNLLNINKPNLTDDEMRFICGLHVHAEEITLSDLNDSQWNNQNFRYAVSCLKPMSQQIWNKLNRYDKTY